MHFLTTMKNDDQDVCGLKCFLLIFLTFNLASAFTFQCPSPYQWNLRAESQCPITDGYICLFDENGNNFTELCRRKNYYDPAGYKLVIAGNLDRRICESAKYQPFKFYTNGSSFCIFEKTFCNGEGQVIFHNGSTESDRQCRCDYTRGYDFITKPAHGCYCIPSIEDCSCYQKPCPVGSIVSPDYQCINLTSWNSQFSCDLMLSFVPKDTTTLPSIDNILVASKIVLKRNWRIIINITIGVAIMFTLVIVQITWFCLPKIESFKDAKKSVMRENVELRSILTGKVIPQNIRDLQHHVKKQWKERFRYFVETTASNAIVERIKEEQCCIITGPFGCGKTSLAFHTAMKLEETSEYDFFIISNPDDLLKYASEDKKQVFLIDDAFGKYSVSEYDTMWWDRQGESILHLVNRNQNLRLLITSRLHIYQLVNLKQVKDIFYFFNLIFKSVALSLDERKIIGKCYLHEDIIDNLDTEVVMLYSFFPMLCEIIQNTIEENIIEYFTYPVRFIKTDIENMKKPQDMFYLVMAVLVICDNNVSKEIFNQANKEYDELLKSVKNELGYDRKPSKHLLFLHFTALIDSYVSEKESHFECINVKMFQTLVFCIGPSIMHSILRYGTSSFIIDKMQLFIAQTPKLTIMVPNSLQDVYFERMFLDMKTGLENIFIGDQHVLEGNRTLYMVYMKRNLRKGDLRTEPYATTVLHHVAEKGYKDYVVFFLNQDMKLLDLQDNLGQTALHKACQKGHLDVIQSLLKKNAKIHLCDYEDKTALDIACSGELVDTAELLLSKMSSLLLKKYDLQSALYVACTNNHLKIAELLLEHKAKVNATDEHGHTPLNLACKHGHLRIVELLIKYQPDVNISSNNGKTALYYAVEKNNVNIVRSLLNSCANPNKVVEKGRVSLHCASEDGSLEIARLLIEYKATVDIDDKQGCTPLYFACKNGHVKVAELLLHNNANANKLNGFQTSPTFIACQHNHIDIVNLLLDHKAVVNRKNVALLTPLHVACLNNHKDMISLLLKHGAFVNEHEITDQKPFYYAQLEGYQIVTAFLSCPIKNDQTPFHIACKIGDEKTVKILLDAGANVNVANSDWITPLHMACEDENERNLHEVSDAGNYVDGDDNDRNKAFSTNCKSGKENIVKLLLENGAKFDAVDKNGISPLHVACKNGNRDILQLLLNAGDDVNKSDDDGITPLHLACKFGKEEIVALLLNAGADVNKRDKNYITPMQVVSTKENKSIKELLLAKSKILV